MKRFITTGLFVLLFAALVVPSAKSEDVTDSQRPVAQPEETSSPQPATKPAKVQAINVEVTPQTTATETLSERDRITLEHRFQRVLPQDAVNSPQTPSAF